MLTLFARPHSGARATMSSSSVATRCARLARAMVTPLIERPARALSSSCAHADAAARDVTTIAGGSTASSTANPARARRERAIGVRASATEMFVREYAARGRTFASTSGSGDEGEGAEGDASEVAASENVTEEKTMTTESAEDGGWVFGIKNQRRPTRRDKGSYDGFLTEMDSYPTRHDVRDVYNAREWVEASLEESCARAEELIDKMMRGVREGEELAAKYADVFPKTLGEEVDPEAVLTWTSEFIMEPGDEQEHPLNWKVSMEVNLSELQRVTGLSDEAIEYIKLLVDKRYNAKQDVLRIVCRRNANREHNRQWCLKVLYDLIQEGNREYPSDSYQFTGNLGGDNAGEA